MNDVLHTKDISYLNFKLPRVLRLRNWNRSGQIKEVPFKEKRSNEMALHFLSGKTITVAGRRPDDGALLKNAILKKVAKSVKEVPNMKPDIVAA